MARALADPVDAAPRAGAPALERGALVGVGGQDDELVAVEGVRGLGVRDGRAQHLLDVDRRGPRRERQDGARLGHAAPADVVEHDPRLAGGEAHVLRLGANLRGSPGGGH